MTALIAFIPFKEESGVSTSELEFPEVLAAKALPLARFPLFFQVKVRGKESEEAPFAVRVMFEPTDT